MVARRITVRRIVVAAVVIVIAMQCVQPRISRSARRETLAVPPHIQQILRTSCYDCHSNETKLLWFDRIAPVSWLVAADVARARERLNFSDPLSAAQLHAILFESVNQIGAGAMPPPRYLAVHRDAAVSSAQLDALKAFLLEPQAQPTMEHTVAALRTASPEQPAGDVRPAPNGIAFRPDYRNWVALSTTERFDNHSLRVILGNDVAVRAATGRVRPWPDGTVLVKVSWAESVDAGGIIHAGDPIQVEFMVKDSVRFRSTLGWGWARWRGRELTPYGTSPAFSSECVGCHTPQHASDYVFTEPIVSHIQIGARP
jgi:cytochrome P460/heme-binding protein